MSHETFYHVIAVGYSPASSTSVLYVAKNEVSFDKKIMKSKR